MKPVYQTVNHERRYTVYRPVIKTEHLERRYTVRRPVYQTVNQERRYTVMKAVYQTEHRERRYSVMKPVYQTVNQERRYSRHEAGLRDGDGRSVVYRLPAGHHRSPGGAGSAATTSGSTRGSRADRRKAGPRSGRGDVVRFVRAF